MVDEPEPKVEILKYLGVWKLSDDGKTIVSEGFWYSQEEAMSAAKKFIDEMLIND